MKRGIVTILLFMIILSACSQTVHTQHQLIVEPEVSDFSWEEDLDRAEHADEYGLLLNTDDFDNTDSSPISDSTDAIERAKEEASEWENLTHVSAAYDSDFKVWKVYFWDPNACGGSVTVYINEDGITLLCVGSE